MGNILRCCLGNGLYKISVIFFYLSLINQKLVMKVVARHKSAHKSAVWHSNLFEKMI